MAPYLRIKFERHQRGWSHRDVAEQPEVQKARPRLLREEISEIERGIRIPTANQLDALGRAFRITPASVLLKPVVIADPEVAS